MKSKFVIGAILIVLVIGIGYFISINYGEDKEKYNYDTPLEAITAYLVSEDRHGEDININDMIMCEQNYGKTTYYVIKCKYAYKDEELKFTKEINYVFAVAVKKYKGKYKCDRVTDDFSLDSPNSVNDIDYTPYIQFVIPTDRNDLYFAAGKIFDIDFYPVYEGERVSVKL